MNRARFGAIRRTYLCALALTLSAFPLFSQVVERGRTYADLVSSHPCNSGNSGRLARVTDAQSSSSIGGGGGSVQVWAVCNGVDTWTLTSIGSAGGGAATAVTGSATLPATCTEKDLYQDTDSGGTEFYVCTAANTWVKTIAATDNVATATALAANGANCSAGNYPLGVDASGAVESCTAAATGTIGGTLGATDNGVCRADGTGGVTAQGSPLTLSDVSGVTTTLATITPAATTGATVAGQSLAITASPAVASTDTAGAAAGGSITITAGAAARNTSGNANGGDINLTPGAGIGTGTSGQVLFQNGTLAKPAAGWAGGISGIYYDAGLHIMHNGAERITLVGAGVQINSALQGQINLLGGFKIGVVASTAGVGSPATQDLATQLGNLFTNEGSTAKNYHALPLAVAGYSFTFCTQDADGLRITANTGDTIRVIDKVTAAAGYIESTTIGSCATLVAINATEWFSTAINGAWTDGTFTYDDTGLTTP